MTNLLSYIFLIPLLVAFVMLVIPKERKMLFKQIAVVTMLIELILAVFVCFNFDKELQPQSWSDAFQFVERADWITMSLGSIGQFRISYFLGVDGISLPLLVLSTIVLLIGALSSWGIQDKVKGYFILYLILASSIIGCFLALDFFLFYLCFEFMLLPMFFLIGIWGGKRRSYASMKFFLYTLLGSLFILVVMIGLYISVEEEGTRSFSMVAMLDGQYAADGILLPSAKNEIFGFSARAVAFVFLLIGFGIKLPTVPLHTWLPDAHVEAPTPISVVLAGLLLKVGSYGLLRVAVGIFPDVASSMSTMIALFGVLSILYGGLNALAQNDLKKVVAYSSVSHMGFVLVGIAALSSVGFSGSLFHMISHGLISPALFLLVGVIYDRTGNREIENFSGLASKMPVFAFFMGIFFFAGLGLPGFSGFVGELMILMGSFDSTIPLSVSLLAVSGIILSAAYLLWTAQRVFFGRYFVRRAEWEPKMTDLSLMEKVMFIPLAFLVIILGVYPRLVLDYSEATLTFFASQFR
ncbi:MAG: NADH-quinone oxidoreductase subunit M [Bacteroidota bacterium]